MAYFKHSVLAIGLTIGVINPTQFAHAHPHVFAESRLEVATSETGEIVELRHVWRFDEVFSSSVVLDFDENKNLELDADELTTIGSIVRESLADFDYYTNVTVDGRDYKMLAPDVINADYQDGQLLLFFAMRPPKPLLLSGTISAGVYDPTFYAAMEFFSDDDLVVTGPLKDKCSNKVIRPDAEEAIAQNQGSLTEAFYDDSDTNDLSKIFATRLELTC